ncbi:glycerol 2-dehydrogenase (NADP(+)) [Trichomonascus vanleenenianus]|uniref:glycerol 2-dehydrogenase (NADP(+)) n=1 Tax=Trichomonascus vanleenenianus TaxID=2268995 RepID=UPI003ECB7CCD
MKMAEISKKTYTLNNGVKMPAVGLGTFNSPDDAGYNAILTALKLGYRHLDTAMMYANEKDVGRAIRESGVPREEIFVTTKLAPTRMKDPKAALDESLAELGLDYVDLYLVHWPCPLAENGTQKYQPHKGEDRRNFNGDKSWDHVRTWELMQPLVESGKVRAIGVSNYDTVYFEELLKAPTTTVVPAVNQVELHPYLPQQKLFDYCKEKNIVLTAYSPLGRSLPVREDPLIKGLAEKYKVNPGQIVLSWGVARGNCVIPRSANAERLGLNLRTVKLSNDEVAQITAQGEKIKQRGVNPRCDEFPLFQDDN